MNDSQEPVLLELAPLPREKIGQFILVGLEKDASPEEVEAHWAQRVIWARKNQIGVALTEINWAREALNDPDKRVRADAASLNVDVTTRILQDLAQRYGVGSAGASWQPLQMDPPVTEGAHPVEIPDPDKTRAAIRIPDVRDILPAVN